MVSTLVVAPARTYRTGIRPGGRRSTPRPLAVIGVPAHPRLTWSEAAERQATYGSAIPVRLNRHFYYRVSAVTSRMTAQIVVCVMLAATACTGARGVQTAQRDSASPVRVTFIAQSDTFAAAVREYTTIWNREGRRIIATMERVTGIRFDSPPYADTAITAIVFEGVSESGYRERPMRMRASYAEATKRATLVHELGHRLQVGVAGSEDEHAVLFLWLYDVWVALWGQPFADEQVVVERARRGPYPAAWDAALALDAAERAARFAQLRDRTGGAR